MKDGANTLVNFGDLRCNFSSWAPSFEVAAVGGAARMMVFHPIGRAEVGAFRLHTGDLVASLQGHMEAVNTCAFRRSTQELFSAGNDGLLVGWVPRRTAVPPTAAVGHVNGGGSDSGTRTTAGGSVAPATPLQSSIGIDCWSDDDAGVA